MSTSERPRQFRAPRHPRSVTPDERGEFVITGLDPGRYILQVWPQPSPPELSIARTVELVRDHISWFGPKPANTLSVELTEGQTLEVALDADPSRAAPGEPTGALAGVFRWNGSVPADARVFRDGLGSKVELSAIQADGTFRCGGLRPGSLPVEIGDGVETYWEGHVDIVAGQTATLRVVTRTRTVHGRLAFPPGVAPKKPALLYATVKVGSGATARVAERSADGSFRLPDLPVGPVEIEVEDESWSGRLEFDLADGSSPLAVVVPLKLRGRLRGRIAWAGPRPPVVRIRTKVPYGDNGWSYRVRTLGADDTFDFGYLDFDECDVELDADGLEFEVEPHTVRLEPTTHVVIREVSRKAK